MNSLDQMPGIVGQTARVSPLYPKSTDRGAIRILFSGGSTVMAHHWRLCERIVRRGQARLTSFDHGQIYGLPQPIDAIAGLRRIEGRPVVESRYDIESGDLIFAFDDGVTLQVLSLTGYEDWELAFPDGTVEYSNYV